MRIALAVTAAALVMVAGCGGSGSPGSSTPSPSAPTSLPGSDVSITPSSLPTGQSSKYVNDVLRAYPTGSRVPIDTLVSAGRPMCAQLDSGTSAPRCVPAVARQANPLGLANSMFAASIADICPQDATAALAQLPTTTARPALERRASEQHNLELNGAATVVVPCRPTSHEGVGSRDNAAYARRVRGLAWAALLVAVIDSAAPRAAGKRGRLAVHRALRVRRHRRPVRAVLSLYGCTMSLDYRTCAAGNAGMLDQMDNFNRDEVISGAPIGSTTASASSAAPVRQVERWRPDLVRVARTTQGGDCDRSGSDLQQLRRDGVQRRDQLRHGLRPLKRGRDREQR